MSENRGHGTFNKGKKKRRDKENRKIDSKKDTNSLGWHTYFSFIEFYNFVNYNYQQNKRLEIIMKSSFCIITLIAIQQG